MKARFFFLLLAAVLLGSASVKAQSETPLKGDVNGDGKVDVADIVAVIEIMKNNGGTTEETTYYWYFGQTDPSTMSSIDTSSTDYNAGGGWTSTGTSVPEQINQLVKGGDASKNWYAAVPITTGTTLKPTWSDMTTIDTGVQPTTTKTYTNGGGVTYQIYIYNNSARKTIIFAKL